jgi:uncharacterized protein YjbI with pentapeptide repeats
LLTALIRRHAAVAKLQTRAPDVHAAMTVLGRAPWRDRSIELQLNDTDLRNAYLPSADLRSAYLRKVHFEEANLPGAVLRGATLRRAHLQHAWLPEADLEDADLRGAHLKRADLSGANLRGANLRGALLEGTDLRGVHTDARTTWPTWFDTDRRRGAGVLTDGDAAPQGSHTADAT